jgi:Zn-finger nucleic acid-binding protein
MKCLRCGDVDLELAVQGDDADPVEIDVCPTCHGVWLDAKELSKLDDNFFVDVEEIEFKDVAPTESDVQLCCPRCAGAPPLRKVSPSQYQGVVVDTCPNCKGFWLDRGELEKMHHASDQALIASLLSLDE